MELVCRTCLNVIKTPDGISLLNQASQDFDGISVRQKLEECVPELSVDIVLDPLICNTCVASISLIFQFKATCLQTEKTLYSYIKQRQQSAICTDLLKQSDLLGIVRNYVSEEHNYSYAPKIYSEVDPQDEGFSAYVKNSFEAIIDQANTVIQKSKPKQKSKAPIMPRSKSLRISVKSPRISNLKKQSFNNTKHYIRIRPSQKAKFKGKEQKLDLPKSPRKRTSITNNIQSEHKITSSEPSEYTADDTPVSENETPDIPKKRQKRKQDNPKKNPLFARTAEEMDNNSNITALNDTTSSLNEISHESTKENQAPNENVDILYKSELLNDLTDNEDQLDVKRSKGRVKKEAFICEKCGKSYDFRCHFVIHLRSHIYKKLFACAFCDKTFAQEKYLDSHLYSHVNKSMYQCTICYKYLKAATALRRHMRIHTGEKPYQCTICSKCFAQKIQRNVHMRIHSGYKPYMCDTCGSCFSQKSHLVGHVRTHTGEKPFACVICPKRFRKSNALNAHCQSHTLKPFQCDGCYVLFKDVDSFERHTNKLLSKCVRGRRTSKVKRCKPKVPMSSNLTIQEDQKIMNVEEFLATKKRKIIREDSEHFCNICVRGYSTKYTYKRHARHHHRNNK